MFFFVVFFLFQSSLDRERSISKGILVFINALYVQYILDILLIVNNQYMQNPTVDQEYIKECGMIRTSCISVN